MFSRGIRICTGTGIGAALSTCIQSPDWFVCAPLYRHEKAADLTVQVPHLDRFRPGENLWSYHYGIDQEAYRT